MVESGGKVPPTFPGTGEGLSVGKVLGQAGQGLGGDLEVFVWPCAIPCTAGVLGKVLVMFVSINHLVIGKRALRVPPAFRSVENSCSGKALHK